MRSFDAVQQLAFSQAPADLLVSAFSLHDAGAKRFAYPAHPDDWVPGQAERLEHMLCLQLQFCKPPRNTIQGSRLIPANLTTTSAQNAPLQYLTIVP